MKGGEREKKGGMKEEVRERDENQGDEERQQGCLGWQLDPEACSLRWGVSFTILKVS